MFNEGFLYKYEELLVERVFSSSNWHCKVAKMHYFHGILLPLLVKNQNNVLEYIKEDRVYKSKWSEKDISYSFLLINF